MELAYGQSYRELYQNHWWFRAREEFLTHFLERNNLANGLALDVGCGDGLFFDELRRIGCTPNGLEADQRLVSEETRQRYRVHIGYLDKHFQPDQPFDLILMLDVLEHIEDDLEALRHAHRCLAPNGALVITVPAFQWLWTNHDDLNHHYRRYTKATLSQCLESADFQPFDFQYFYNWLVPVKLMVKAQEAVFERAPSNPQLPSASVNRILKSISRIEQKVTSVIKLPFGSSLLMASRKKTEPHV
jgi:SAM-dependent methyltransferase